MKQSLADVRRAKLCWFRLCGFSEKKEVSTYNIPMAEGQESRDSMQAILRDALDSSGKLQPIKAQLRALVFQALDSSSPETKVRLPPPPENILINELIREYLQFNGYESTASVLCTEAGLGDAVSAPRSVVATQLRMHAAPKEVPLLYSIIHELRESES